MLTYRVRPRVFRLASPEPPLKFPADATINLYFRPDQPFGVTPGGGRTAVRAVKASTFFNANTGHHYIESADPLKPLDVRIKEPTRTVTVRGNMLVVRQRVESLHALRELVESLYYALPMLLAVEFADPPYIERVDGEVGPVGFRWELAEWKARFLITTQEKQEEAVAKSWERLGLLSVPERRRLVAALHYYHTARRLLVVSSTPGEFLAEALLNFAKSLEALFPPSAGVGTMDAARAGLHQLGFADSAMEARFIPAIVLRNQVDVGHVDLTLFTTTQLTTLHEYAESAEDIFKDLFERVLVRVAAGTFVIVPGYAETASAEDRALIDRMAAAMAAEGAT